MAAAILIAGCAGDGAGANDMAAPASICGHPGDVGNSIGVGMYCTRISDCTKKASLCTTLGSNNTFFCTRSCDPGSDMGLVAQCGENARCACQGGQCGCYPSACP